MVRVGFESSLQCLDGALAAAGRVSELDRFKHFFQILLDKVKAVPLRELEHFFTHGERANIGVFLGNPKQDR